MCLQRLLSLAQQAGKMRAEPWFTLALLSTLNMITAQVSISLLSDQAFHLDGAEAILSRQRTSWGIPLGPVNLGFGPGFHLGVGHLNVTALAEGALDIRDQERDLRRSRRRRSSRRGGQARTAGSRKRQGEGLGINLGVDLPISLGGLGWGGAEARVRGDLGDTEWYTYISVGSPPQLIPVVPDSGSSDLFVFGPSCSSCSLFNHTYFSPDDSSTFVDEDLAWTFGYADGSGIAGFAATDIVSFGSEQVSVDMAFAVASAVRGSSFLKSAKSGVLGLAQDSLSTYPDKNIDQGSTLFSRLVTSGQLPEALLSVRLVKGLIYRGEVYQEGSGEYVFGGIEDWYVRGGRAGLAWAPVTSSKYWGLGLDDISVGPYSLFSYDTSTPRRAIVDTGTTLIITSDRAATTIHALLPQAFVDPQTGIWYVPCDIGYPAAKNVFFHIAGRKFGVPAEDLAWKASTVYDGKCVSGVQGGNTDFTVLGDVFIKNHYVVFSYGSRQQDNLQIGLGDRADLPKLL